MSQRKAPVAVWSLQVLHCVASGYGYVVVKNFLFSFNTVLVCPVSVVYYIEVALVKTSKM